MAKKKNDIEKGTVQPELQSILDSLESYREQLFVSSTVSATKFEHAQTAIHNCKNIIRDHFGAPRKSDTAWVKN